MSSLVSYPELGHRAIRDGCPGLSRAWFTPHSKDQMPHLLSAPPSSARQRKNPPVWSRGAVHLGLTLYASHVTMGRSLFSRAHFLIYKLRDAITAVMLWVNPIRALVKNQKIRSRPVTGGVPSVNLSCMRGMGPLGPF